MAVNQGDPPSHKLFGTDGIRDLALQGKLAPDMIRRVGMATAAYLKDNHLQRTIIVGCDTRGSCEDIRGILQPSLESQGIRVTWMGVLPTPAVACLTKQADAGMGVVISASHNPADYNGIKLFTGDGLKASEALERELERRVASMDSLDAICGPEAAPENPSGLDAYCRMMLESTDASIRSENLKVVIDCAHGATYQAAPRIFEQVAGEVIVMCASPDGYNINQNAGALHPNQLADHVRQHHADLGISFDGDGDRAIVVDADGRIVDGDVIMAVLARDRKKHGRLAANTVVATVMSNLGLEISLEEADIQLVRTDVGDRNVVFEMLRLGAMIGGEQSGHIILLDHATTGDGIRTGLQIMEVMARTGRALSDLARCMRHFPQVLKNIRVREKPDLMTIPAVRQAMEKAQSRLGRRGRMVLRYSGTEPLARVMMEGEDAMEIEALTDGICAAIAAHIGLQ